MSLEALFASITKPAWLPFIMVVRDGDKKMQLNMQRMIEAVIIGLCIGLVGYMTVVPRMEERLVAVQASIEQVRQQNLQHMGNGHPWNVIEQVRALENRIHRLEKQTDGH